MTANYYGDPDRASNHHAKALQLGGSQAQSARIVAAQKLDQKALGAGADQYVRTSVEGYPAHLAMHVTAADRAAAEINDRKITANDPEHTYTTECGATAASGQKRPRSAGSKLHT